MRTLLCSSLNIAFLLLTCLFVTGCDTPAANEPMKKPPVVEQPKKKDDEPDLKIDIKRQDGDSAIEVKVKKKPDESEADEKDKTPDQNESPKDDGAK